MKKVWEDTLAESQQASIENGDDPQVGNLRALQAMATLDNFQKFGGKLPPELAEDIPPELWDKIKTAGNTMNSSESPDAAVMSHGVPAKIPDKDAPDDQQFTADHNFHFFSHAYLAASLVHDEGLEPEQAEAVSAMIGAQYELKPESLAEGGGNSGIKDVLMNAEGARFGTDLLTMDRTLPDRDAGPPVENRHAKDIPVKELSPQVQSISDEAFDGETNKAYMINKYLFNMLR
jgi:hypothetical protein